MRDKSRADQGDGSRGWVARIGIAVYAFAGLFVLIGLPILYLLSRLFPSVSGFYLLIMVLPIVTVLTTMVMKRCREWRVPRRGCCPKCGYDLTGNVSGVCPECGSPLAKRQDQGSCEPGSPDAI